jgi:hypothetical protein
MSRFASRARAAVTLAALTLGALSAAAPFAAASTTSSGAKVPFTDPNIQGWLTFCNRKDQPVTSGSLYTVPFVWKAISSAAAPAGYRNLKARATLYAYQPIQYVDPGDWAGSQLTGDTIFNNPSHPVAQATNGDLPLIGFVQSYPLHWDNYAEIRMMWTAANKSQLQTPYAAAIVRVTGSTWTLVEGGGGSCSQGAGLSVELLAPGAIKKLAKPESAAPGGTPTPAGVAGTAPASSGGSAASGQSQGQAGGATTGRLAADSSPAGGMGIGALAGIAVAALAVAWGAITLIGRRRRRAAS